MDHGVSLLPYMMGSMNFQTPGASAKVSPKVGSQIPFTREAWLLFAVDAVAPIFSEKGYSVPRVPVSCAIPSNSVRGSAVGQCWNRQMSSIAQGGLSRLRVSRFYAHEVPRPWPPDLPQGQHSDGKER